MMKLIKKLFANGQRKTTMEGKAVKTDKAAGESTVNNSKWYSSMMDDLWNDLSFGIAPSCTGRCPFPLY